MANGILNGIGAIVHDARMLVRRHGKDAHYVRVSIYASNAFNIFSRKNVLDQLPTRAPSLSRYLDMVYARAPSPLGLPSCPYYHTPQQRRITTRGPYMHVPFLACPLATHAPHFT